MRAHLDIAELCRSLEIIRVWRGLNWKQVSEATGVSQSTLSKMTLHGRAPDVDSFLSLLRWMNLPADSFYANDSPGILAR